MNMVLNGNISQIYLFSWIQTTSPLDVTVVCLVVFMATVGLQFFKSSPSNSPSRNPRLPHQPELSVEMKRLSVDDAGEDGKRGIQRRNKRYGLRDHAVRTLVYICRLTAVYLVMLLVMTMNVYVITSALLGATTGVLLDVKRRP